MPSCQAYACQARTPSKFSLSYISYAPSTYHHRITFPLTSTPFKPGLNYNADRPLSFAPFHMLISLFVGELCSSKSLPSSSDRRRPVVFFFSSSGIAILDLGGTPS